MTPNGPIVAALLVAVAYGGEGVRKGKMIMSETPYAGSVPSGRQLKL